MRRRDTSSTGWQELTRVMDALEKDEKHRSYGVDAGDAMDTA